MSFKQAMLMITNVLLIIIWIFIWGSTKREYPKIEEMITFEGSIVAVQPVDSGRRRGFIDIESNKIINRFETYFNEETLSKLGDITGKNVIIMVRPRSSSPYSGLPQIEHFEFTNGTAILDYKKELNDHSKFMKNHVKILTSFGIFIVVFFILSFQKK